MSEDTRKQEMLFASTLEKVCETAKGQGNVISTEQVEQEFAGLNLSGDQLSLVFDYLEKHRIGIGEPLNPEEYLTQEDVNYLEMYLEELSLLEQVSEGKKQAVTISAMSGEKAAQTKLIEIYLPYVVEIAKLYAGQGVLMEDLIGEGNMALALGVGMLGCAEHAQEAEGLLGKMIMDAMEESITEAGSEGGSEKELVAQVDKIYNQARDMAENLLRKVTVEELSRETGTDKELILHAMQMMGGGLDYIEEIKDAE